MSSNWLIALTVLYRLISIKYPTKGRMLNNQRVALYSLLFIFLISLICITPMFALLVPIRRCTPDRKMTYESFDMDLNSDKFKAKSYLLVIEVLFFYLPWLTTLFIWFFLLYNIRRGESGRTNSILSNTSGGNVEARFLKRFKFPSQIQDRLNNRITLMILVMVLVFLICQFFTFLFTTFELVYNKIEFSSFVNENSTTRFLDAQASYPKFMAKLEFISLDQYHF